MLLQEDRVIREHLEVRVTLGLKDVKGTLDSQDLMGSAEMMVLQDQMDEVGLKVKIHVIIKVV